MRGGSSDLHVSSRVEVVVESLAAGGEGVARVDGRVFFVPRAAPADRALIEITELARHHGRARIVELLEPGPERRSAPCRHAELCGSCSWQHVTPAGQRAAKSRIVGEALARIAGIRLEVPVEVVHGDELHYRNRADLSIAKGTDGMPRLGYRREGSHVVEHVSECPVLVPVLESELRRFAATPADVPADAAAARFAAGDDGARIVFVDAKDVVLGRPVAAPKSSKSGSAGPVRRVRVDEADLRFEQSIGGLRYGFDVRAFWQGNAELVGELVRRAVGDESGDTAYDLFCGSGLFTLPLSARFERVVGVENDDRAIARASTNAERNGVERAVFVASDVERHLRTIDDGAAPDLVLLDPPRRGAGTDVVAHLVRIAPRRVRYVSCDPATLARDLKGLVSGGYRLRSIVALDLFPQTPHVECVAVLERDGDPM